MDHKQHFSIWYFLTVLLILLALQDFALSPPVETLAYSDFKALLQASRVAALGDDGTNDLIISDVIRTGEKQAWFLAEHLVETPLVRA